MKIAHYLIPIFSFLLASCGFKSKDADLVIYNASSISTMDPGNTLTQAIAIKDGKIVALGKEREILNQYNATQTLDAKKGFIYPGFHDAHCHFLGFATNLYRVDLKGTRSAEEVIGRLKAFAKVNPEATWITGRGYDQTLWKKGEPHKAILDTHFRTTPIVIQRIDGHAVWGNSKALELAGISAKTKIEGGLINLDDNGTTGIVLEMAGDHLLSFVPPLTTEQKEKALMRAQDLCFAAGLTYMTDAGLPWADILILDSLAKVGKIKIGLNVMVQNQPDDIQELVKTGGINQPNFRVQSIKVYGDGSLGSRSACLKEHYADKHDHFGITVIQPDSLKKIADIAYANNLQLNIHSIGDSTSAMVLGVFGEVLQSNNDKRWRIEHAQVLDPKDHQKIIDLRIIPSVQPTHATSDRRWAIDRVGADKKDRLYAYKSLLKLNGILPFGTDFPVEEIHPLSTFQSAVFRRSDTLQAPFLPEEGLDAKTALLGMTVFPAIASFLEDSIGSIAVGKYGDIVILNRKLETLQEGDFNALEIRTTVKRGEIVYSKQ
ncbi:MAG: putative amidohydrolase YtcJ [Sphingobacteriales bacterium]|jgi:predicted amidohydrolase YtcJ